MRSPKTSPQLTRHQQRPAMWVAVIWALVAVVAGCSGGGSQPGAKAGIVGVSRALDIDYSTTADHDDDVDGLLDEPQTSVVTTFEIDGDQREVTALLVETGEEMGYDVTETALGDDAVLDFDSPKLFIRFRIPADETSPITVQAASVEKGAN